RALYAALDPNGLLLIDIPNLDRLSVRRAIRRGELEPGEYPPHHTTFWTRSSLAFALRHAGFEVQHCHAHPLGAEGQIEIFIRNRLRLRAPRLVAALGAGLRQMGRILDWQGEALLALARRPAAAGAAPPG
ncbi:MAG: hypothetical protein KA764_21900, partial [Anaerolineales bacterium]|nr:hypothetical protein [Anaerolineales bacterium]